MYVCNMESKENTDEDVKKENFFFFFSSLLRSEIPSVYFSSSSSSSSSFFCRPEKVVTLYFSLALFLNYLASYPAALLFLPLPLSLYCRVKFLSSKGNLIRLLFCLSDEKKRGCCYFCSRLLLYRLDNLFFFILL